VGYESELKPQAVSTLKIKLENECSIEYYKGRKPNPIEEDIQELNFMKLTPNIKRLSSEELRQKLKKIINTTDEQINLPSLSKYVSQKYSYFGTTKKRLQVLLSRGFSERYTYAIHYLSLWKAGR